MKEPNNEDFENALRKMIAEAKKFNRDEKNQKNQKEVTEVNSIEDINLSSLFNNGTVEQNNLNGTSKSIFSKRPERNTIISEDDIEKIYIETNREDIDIVDFIKEN